MSISNLHPARLRHPVRPLRDAPPARIAAVATIAATVALLGVGAATVARAYPGPPAAAVQMPYQAELVDASGEPLEGTYDVVVRIYADGDPTSAVLWEESFTARPVVDGRLSLVIGTGTALAGQLDGATLASHPDAAVELELDGESMGAPALVGTVPRAVHADTVAASGVLWGGGFGRVPASAVDPGVAMYTGTYAHGESIPTVAGWDCTHHVSMVNPASGLTDDAIDLHRHDLWLGHVGPDPVPVRDGLTYTPGQSTPAAELQLVHAHTECVALSSSCSWSFDPATSARARVLTVCRAL